jgi:hypothetical protein
MRHVFRHRPLHALSPQVEEPLPVVDAQGYPLYMPMVSARSAATHAGRCAPASLLPDWPIAAVFCS